MRTRDPREWDGQIGYDPRYGKSPELKIQELLDRKLPELSQSLQSLQSFQQGSSPINVSVDTSILANQLDPALRELADTQEMLANNIAGLGIVGMKMLEGQQLTIEELRSLNDNQRDALEQRERALQHLHSIQEGIVSIAESINTQTEAINLQTHRITESLDWLGGEIRGVSTSITQAASMITEKLEDANDIAIFAHMQNLRSKRKQTHALENSHINEFVTKARILISEGDYKKAYEYLEIAQNHNPTHPPTWFALTLCLIKLNRLEEAKEYAKALIQIAKKGHYRNLARKILHKDEFKKIRGLL